MLKLLKSGIGVDFLGAIELIESAVLQHVDDAATDESPLA
jgi:hypothetical protein